MFSHPSLICDRIRNGIESLLLPFRHSLSSPLDFFESGVLDWSLHKLEESETSPLDPRVSIPSLCIVDSDGLRLSLLSEFPNSDPLPLLLEFDLSFRPVDSVPVSQRNNLELGSLSVLVELIRIEHSCPSPCRKISDLVSHLICLSIFPVLLLLECAKIKTLFLW